MKRFFQTQIITVGLAIFSMFFGAGNLIFPLRVGLLSGELNFWGISGFIITGVILPLLGLIAIVLFNGDYKTFFYRIGKVPGSILLLYCMLIIGPFIAMPRIVTLSHIMIAPFLGNISLILFSIIFLVLTFLGTYKENKIINLLGNYISPALLVSLLIIIIKGLLFRDTPTTATETGSQLFVDSLVTGYQTLDLLGAIFFSSIVLTLLKKALPNQNESSLNKIALLGFKSGAIGVSLLAIIYIGMSYLGVFHGQGLAHLNEGELFSAVSFRVLGDYGAIIIAIAVLMACYSTIIALAVVFAEFLQKIVSNNSISYLYSLIITLITTGIISNFGLASILKYSGPIINIGYPVLIVLMFLNIAYKMFDFKPVKTPVAIAFILSIAHYLRMFI